MDLVVGILFLLVVFLALLVYVNSPRSLGYRWFGRRGAILISLAPALCLMFAFCMMWLFLIPSSEAIKHWDVVQQNMIAPPCTVEDLDAAYNAAFDRWGPIIIGYLVFQPYSAAWVCSCWACAYESNVKQL
jgi:hypothetical protein